MDKSKLPIKWFLLNLNNIRGRFMNEKKQIPLMIWRS